MPMNSIIVIMSAVAAFALLGGAVDALVTIARNTAMPKGPNLAPCPDCRWPVSTLAATCPRCGRPLRH